MPWEGSTGADNVAADFRTSRVPSEYKRVVGASFRKYVCGLESTQTVKTMTNAKTITNIILNDDELSCACADAWTSGDDVHQVMWGHQR
jgi:hypothetical protein